jgi:hypothetical protein
VLTACEVVLSPEKAKACSFLAPVSSAQDASSGSVQEGGATPGG